jgi:hypothetical protein
VQRVAGGMVAWSSGMVAWGSGMVAWWHGVVAYYSGSCIFVLRITKYEDTLRTH